MIYLPLRGNHLQYLLVLFAIGLFAANCFAQPKPTNAADYNGTFSYAVSETNAAFPFIFTVVTEDYERGKLVATETYINERQSAGIERIIQTTVKGGQQSVSYQVRVGFGNVFCSTDGSSWEGPQKYECPRSTRRYGREQILGSEYTVEEKIEGVNNVKIYREYLTYRPANGKSSIDNFRETLATIDERGFFTSVVNIEGTLNPKTTKLIRKQTWDFKTKFKPIVPPK